MIFGATGAFLALIIVSATLWIKHRNQRPTSRADGNTPQPEDSTLADNPLCMVLPASLVVRSGEQDVMAMALLDNVEAANRQLSSMTKLPLQSIPDTLKSMIEPLLQAVPATSTAIMANSRKLMEVVINGEMLAASDGNGYRAIAKAAKGFEHARLHVPSNLQNAANAAAIWQIASVVVAQKHLADISATLKRIESQVDGIQSTLEEARTAIIQSVIDYLNIAKNAIDDGEFLERTRARMEDFDTELNRVELTLRAQIMREAEKKLEPDMFGCESEYRSALAKHRHLNSLTDELALCNETRLANWYLCSIYPDSSKMIMPRLEQIKEGIRETSRIKEHLEKSAKHDCDLIDGSFTTDNTIHERRSEIKHENGLRMKKLQSSIRRNNDTIKRIEAIHADRLTTSRLIIEAKDGVPAAIYLHH
ncbi:hypothetical protein H9L17_10080 [Thermomonas brevis]|uniref:Uncharacterized protein n=1 Tax=Thermomonas brevis TaxID=215691 RepID=A0A7G9QQE0_9GAMM|nr:hypothetical protein [Thermomonas brevis]QNN45565.1 hypothetical protein H9L17_10080 [Thermomonas brevis]